MLNTAYDDGERPPKPDAKRVTAHANTGLFIGCPDVDAMCAHLRAHGVAAPDPKIAWYGMKPLYVRDPDGFGVCFQWPLER